jgi:MFS family permease
VFVGSVACAFSQLLMLEWHTSVVSPIIGMVIIGVSYSLLAASLWPCVALIVKSHELGTAYGLMTAIQNSGLSIAPPLTGLLLGKDANNPRWAYAIWYFVFNFACSAVIAVFLGIYDWYSNGVLNASASVRKQRQKEMEEAEAAEGGSTERVIVDERGVVIRTEAQQLLAPRSVQVIRNTYLQQSSSDANRNRATDVRPNVDYH